MGPDVLHTNRLILSVEKEDKADKVLQLYLNNQLTFDRFEPTRPKDFYTTEYHRRSLHREFIAYTMDRFLRYYIYSKSDLSIIIGSLNFNFFNLDNSFYAEMGYKIDSDYTCKGICYEAASAGMQIIRDYYKCPRIDLRIHPDNAASIRLASKLGFSPVRLEPKSANILGKECDIIRYSLSFDL